MSNNLNQGASIEAERANPTPWRITAPDERKGREIVDALGDTVAKLTVLDMANAELIVVSVNARRTPAATTGDGELPPLPGNVAHVTRRIRRCESDVPAQVVLEHFAMEYARAAIEADRAQRQVAPASAQPAEDLIGDLQAEARQAKLDEAVRGWSAQPDQRESAAEGWRWVPVKLTEEMHVAAVRRIVRCTGNDDFPPAVWAAMLAAAPSPAAQPAKDEQKGDSA